MQWYLSVLDAVPLGLAHFGEGDSNIHLDDINCYGNESVLVDCTSTMGAHNCLHNEDAGVRCQGNSSSQFLAEPCTISAGHMTFDQSNSCSKSLKAL